MMTIDFDFELLASEFARHDLGYWLRKLVTILIWFFVGFRIIPAANYSRRNPVLWYFVGIGAFFLPYLVIGYGTIFSVYWLYLDDKVSGDAANNFIAVAFGIGALAGIALLTGVRLFLLSHPRRAMADIAKARPDKPDEALEAKVEP